MFLMAFGATPHDTKLAAVTFDADIGDDLDGADDTDDTGGATIWSLADADIAKPDGDRDSTPPHERPMVSCAGVIGGFNAPTGLALIELIRQRDPRKAETIYC